MSQIWASQEQVNLLNLSSSIYDEQPIVVEEATTSHHGITNSSSCEAVPTKWAFHLLQILATSCYCILVQDPFFSPNCSEDDSLWPEKSWWWSLLGSDSTFPILSNLPQSLAFGIFSGVCFWRKVWKFQSHCNALLDVGILKQTKH